MKACQVLSSEIDLQKLLANMMKIIIQNAGAERGFFLVPDEQGSSFVLCLFYWLVSVFHFASLFFFSLLSFFPPAHFEPIQEVLQSRPMEIQPRR